MESASAIISASAVSAIGTTLSTNIAEVAPAILGVMAVVIVPVVILKLVRRFSNKA